MCTSIRLGGAHMYFGRNMDIECSFGECVALAPRNYPIRFRKIGEISSHYAILGMAGVIDSYPLYADAFNEKGLCIAGLNFPINTRYIPLEESDENKHRVTPFELPLFLLSKCKSVAECKLLLGDTDIVDISFSDSVKLTPLHWHIADREESAVIECLPSGLSVKSNPADVLANNPPFDYQLINLAQYQNLTPNKTENCLSKLGDFHALGKAFGAVGLPGDFSSMSRFVKSAYLTALTKALPGEDVTLSHLFTLLRSVAVPKGAVIENEKSQKSHYTLYTSGIDIEKKSYSYLTYDSIFAKSVFMYEYDVDSSDIMRFDL